MNSTMLLAQAGILAACAYTIWYLVRFIPSGPNVIVKAKHQPWEKDPHRQDPYGRLNSALKRHGINKEIWGETPVGDSAIILIEAFAEILERIETKRDE
jgi:hypothetical protein